MKIIKDIRLYKSEVENIDGNAQPISFSTKAVNNTVRRVVMKLSGQGFSLGDFHHLYINFTTCITEGTFQPAKRTVDRYYPWYRYYDVGISKELFDKIDNDEYKGLILDLTKQTLLNCFADSEDSKLLISNAFNEAISKGEEMLVPFKVKQGTKYKAVIYLRYLENTRYFPLLCVYDENETEILRKDLPLTNDLSYIGEIICQR